MSVTPELLKAITEFQKTCPAIAKGGTGYVGRQYQYAQLDDINHVINPLLAKQGLFISHTSTIEDNLITRVYHVGGGYMESVSPVKIDASMKNNTHAWGSALTYTKRYITCCLLNLVTGEFEDDGVEAGKVEDEEPPMILHDEEPPVEEPPVEEPPVEEPPVEEPVIKEAIIEGSDRYKKSLKWVNSCANDDNGYPQPGTEGEAKDSRIAKLQATYIISSAVLSDLWGDQGLWDQQAGE